MFIYLVNEGVESFSSKVIGSYPMCADYGF